MTDEYPDSDDNDPRHEDERDDMPPDPHPFLGDELDDPPPQPSEDPFANDVHEADHNRDTDRANAKEFVDLFGEEFIWTPEGGWFVWLKTRWKPDDGLDRHAAVGYIADQLWRAFEETGDEITGRRAKRLESVNGMNGCLTFAQHKLVRSIIEFDRDLHLLNVVNGTIDLRTGTMKVHDRHDLITRMCPTPYDPAAQDIVWNQVIWDAFDGDTDMARFLGRFIGYSLTGETLEKSILVVNGPTNSGKSTVTEAVYKTIGDVAEGGYACTWPADMIQAGTQVNRDYLMDKSRGSRMIIVAELEKGSRMADSFVKQVSGGDVMNHRRVYAAPYDARPTAKLVMHSNYVPRSTDSAVHARLKLLPFEHSARGTSPVLVPFLDSTYGAMPTGGPDPRIRMHLETSMNARRAILAWAVNGAKRWYEQGFKIATPWMDQAMERYILESDQVWAFVRDCLEDMNLEPIKHGSLYDPRYEESILADQAYMLYQVWAVENVPRPLKRRMFDSAMEERGLKKARFPARGGKIRWAGYRQNPDLTRDM